MRRAAQWLLLAVVLAAAIAAYSGGYLRSFDTRGRVADFFQEWASARNYYEGLPIYAPQWETAVRYLDYRQYALDEAFVDVNAHPPVTVLLALPFGRLSHEAGYALWNALTIAGWIAAVVLVVRGDARVMGRYSILPALALSGWPMVHHLRMGQLGVFLLLMLLAAFRADQRRQPYRAGFWIGVAAAVKVFPAFLLVYFIMKRQWRAVAAAAVSFTALNLTALAVFGPQTYVDFFTRSMPAVLEYRDWHQNHTIASMWHRLFEAHSGQIVPLAHWPLLARIGSWVTVLALVCWVLRVLRRDEPGPSRAGFAVCISAMLLASPVCWPHYFPLLLLPLVVIDNRLPARGAALRAALYLSLGAFWMNPESLWVHFVNGVASVSANLLLLSLPFFALLTTFLLGVRVARPAAARDAAIAYAAATAARRRRGWRRSWAAMMLLGIPPRRERTAAAQPRPAPTAVPSSALPTSEWKGASA